MTLLAGIEVGVLVIKLSQLIPLSIAKRANPWYFVLFCGIRFELAGCVHRPIMGSDIRLRPNQTLISHT
jgi:hypothetical protein